MVIALHALIYSERPEETRVFLRDVLGLPFVEGSASGEPGWLIFKTGPSELGVHPLGDGEATRHQVSLITDDLAATRAELESRGAEFSTDILDHGYGLVSMLRVPGAEDLQVYQPRHDTAYDLES